MRYEVIIPLRIQRAILKLDKKIKDRILNKLLELEENPQLGKHLIGIPYWSLRIGKYRIIYEVEQNKLKIYIISIKHRKEVYRL